MAAILLNPLTMLFHRAILKVDYLSGKGLSLPLFERLLIGRSPSADLLVGDMDITETWATVVWDGKNYRLIVATTGDNTNTPAAVLLQFGTPHKLDNLQLTLLPAPRAPLFFILLTLLLLGGVTYQQRSSAPHELPSKQSKVLKELDFQYRLLTGIGYKKKAARLAEKIQQIKAADTQNRRKEYEN